MRLTFSLFLFISNFTFLKVVSFTITIQMKTEWYIPEKQFKIPTTLQFIKDAPKIRYPPIICHITTQNAWPRKKSIFTRNRHSNTNQYSQSTIYEFLSNQTKTSTGYMEELIDFGITCKTIIYILVLFISSFSSSIYHSLSLISLLSFII